MNIVLDIDGTITRCPAFFRVLARSIRDNGGKVYIVTSRSTLDGVKDLTRKELNSYRIEFDELIIISDKAQYQVHCPHDDLDWYEKYLWQKVAFCLNRNVKIVFEDDSRVISLFEKYAPDIQVFQVK